MRRTYHHLSPEDRAMIMIERQNGSSLRSIARRLGRSPSTLSRELRRAGPGMYDATRAAEGYRERRGASRRSLLLTPGTALYQHVHDRLVFSRWSPQQIAARLRQMPESERPGLVSHETIYATIYAQPRGALKQGMVAALRQSKPRRGRRRTTASACSFVPEALRIENRPEHIGNRLAPGHWEGDFIKGAYNRSAVACWWNARHASWCSVAWTAAQRRMRWKASLAR